MPTLWRGLISVELLYMIKEDDSDLEPLLQGCANGILKKDVNNIFLEKKIQITPLHYN